MAETTMITTRGELVVARPNTPRASPLRAWSAADVLVINELASTEAGPGQMLIVNDEFGALSCAFAGVSPTIWSDSASSRAAIDHNLAANGLAAVTPDRLVPGHEQPQGDFDTIVVRIPKTSALLDYQLLAIAAIAEPKTAVIGTGMVRHIHTSTVKAFERLIGPTTTSKATRKARLIHSTRNDSTPNDTTPNDTTPGVLGSTETTFMTADGVHVVEMPGTFSAGHLDVGSALLLQILNAQPVPAPGALVADLGCGNGILAASIARSWTTADFLLLDASDLAIEAATRTWQANELGDRMTAQVADGFGGTASTSVDVVVTNPPFHQGHAADNDLADRLLADAARVLRPSGVAYVVAQRHLNLHTRLLQWFTEVEVASGHPSHVVLIAKKS